MNDIDTLLREAQSFLGLTLAEAKRALGGEVDVVADDEYGQMSHLTSLTAPGSFAGTLYLKEGVVELVRIGHDPLAATTPGMLRETLPEPGVRLPSRAGKTAGLVVHAEHGIAYSSDRDSIHFLELFKPCSLQAYQDGIYQKPPRFIR